MKLQNKTILLTGASGGFGQALIQEFIKLNCQIIATDLSLEGIQKLILDYPSQIHPHKLDVTKSSDFESLCKKLKTNKLIPDVWINNAGIVDTKEFSKSKQNTFDKVMDVNFRGTVLGCRFALDLMKNKKEACIANIASVAGHIPTAYLSSYVSSKHAVVGFTRSVQIEQEIKNSNIRFLIVSPGFFDTQIMKQNTKEFELPTSFDFMVASPETVAKETLKAIRKNQKECFPAITGKVFPALYKYSPKFLSGFIAKKIGEVSRKS